MNFLQPDHTPLVMDIQDDQIVAVQLVRRKGKWQPAASVTVRRQAAPESGAEKTLALSEEELATLERALVRQGVIGRQIVLLSPPGATCIELLELPPRGPETPIEQLARAEISRLARWDDATPFQLCTWDVPSPQRRAGSDVAATTSLYAAGLKQNTVDSLLQCAWDLGWSIQRIVPAPIAAAAIASESIGSSDLSAAEGSDRTTVVVDLRCDRASFTLVRGESPIYYRDLPDNGLSLLTRAIVSDLRLSHDDVTAALQAGSFELRNQASRTYGLCESFAEALAMELEASLAFAARRYGELKVKSLVVVGPGARIGGLDQWLSARLEVESGASADAVTTDPSFASCVAVAKASMGSMRDRGLLPNHQRDLLRREHVARLWIAATVTVVLFAAASVATLYATTFAPAGPDAVRLTALQQEQARADAAAAEAKRELAGVRAVAAFQDRVTHQPDYGIVIRLIGSTLDADAILREISLTEAATPRSAVPTAVSGAAATLRRVKLAGVAPSASILTQQVNALRAIDVFDRVELARTSRSATGDGVSFELTLDVVARTSTQGSK